MKKLMPVSVDQASMWKLTEDRKAVRLDIPPLRLTGSPEPLAIHMYFDVETVDAILERLAVLRSQMLLRQPSPKNRN